MITEFKIENFKSFANAQAFNLAPITLIYGPNSSGKSSLIQALMMLKQSILSRDKDGELITTGNDINLGTFESLIHGQDNNLEMSFQVKYKNHIDARDFKQTHSYNLLFSNTDIRSIDLSYKSLSQKAQLDKYVFSCGDNDATKAEYSLSRGISDSLGSSFKLTDSDSLRKIISSRSKLSKNDGRGWIKLDNELSSPFRFGTHLNLPTSTSITTSELHSYLEKVSNDIQIALEGIRYLGPLRSSPKRFYSDAINNYQKGQGKNNLGFEIYNASSKVKNKINEALQQFKIPYTIDVKNLGDTNTGPLISVQLTDLRNGAVITPKDVGFGIGQVLPIVLDAIVSRNKIICVEQPEIHLHPKLQAHLADLFIDSTEKEKNNQWIIETHSEALMLRLQRRVREKRISKELVSIIYVDVGEKGAQITPISLDDEGDFTTLWPEGFFEERLDEVFGG